MRNQRLSIYGVCLIFIMTIFARAQSVPVTIIDGSGKIGDEVVVAIDVGDLSGLNVYSYESVVTYDPSVLEARSPYASSDGTISSPWGAPTANSPNSSTISFGGFGTSPLSGSGTLVYLLFTVVGDPGSSTDITFSNFVFNAGTPGSTTESGTFTVLAEEPVAEFTSSSTSGPAPWTVDFTDESTGDVSSWSWEFGDGGSSTVQNPSHTYSNPGTYTVALTVSGAGGSDTETKVNYITVTSPTIVTVDIPNDLSDPQGTEIEIPIIVDDLTGLDVYSYEGVVNFDPSVLEVRSPYASSDGTISSPWGAPTANSPNSSTISFGGFGTSPLSGSGTLVYLLFTVVGDPGSSTDITFSNFVFNAGTPGSTTESGTFTVLAEEPVAKFTSSSTSGPAPWTVDFTDESTGDISSWSWEFGDGGSSTVQNPSHTYSNPGTYTVALTVSGAGGSDTETKVDYITVTSSTIVTVDIPNDLSDPQGTEIEIPIIVDDLTGLDVYSYEGVINFDPSVLEVRSPYASSDGTISSPWGAPTANSPNSSTISFGGFGTSPLSGSGTLVYLLFTVVGDPGSSTDITFSNFVFNAGTPGSTTESGTFTVLAEEPVAEFTSSSTSGPAPWTVDFTDESTGDVSSWSWEFGDGGSSTVQNPSHTYSNPGTYTVALTVSGAGGSDTETKVNYITVTSPTIVTVDIPNDLSDPQWTEIEIPIIVDDLTGLDVYSYEGVVNFDPSVLEVRSPYASSDGTISSPWGAPTANSPNSSTISFGGFGTSPLSGSGTLVYLLFTVVGDPGSSTDITFSNFVFNAGTPGSTTENGTFTVSVVEPYLTVEPPNQVVTSAAGQTTFNVTSNLSWTVSESVGWLSVSPTDGSDDGILTVTYDENTTTSERVGTISVSGSGITRNVTVTQAEGEPRLTVTPSSRDVGYAAGQTSFDVSSNISWTVSESVSWLSVSPTSGSDDGTLTVTYNENPSTSERLGTISVSGSGITRNVTVTQAEAEPHLTVTPPNQDVGYAAGQTSFEVTSNVSWTVNESVGWLSVSPTSGSDDGTLTVTYDENTSTSERVGTISVLGSGITQEVSITQAEAEPRLTVTPSNWDVPSEAGQNSFEVTSNVSWTVNESVSWLSVSPTSGSDDGTLTVTYDENTSTSERVGTISVSGEGLTRNVTVTQAEAEPRLIVTPSNRDVGFASGQTTFDVSSNISWTVSESVGWLSVSPASGNDNGILTVSYDAQTTTSERVGTISISGSGITREVTVSQAGAPASLTVDPSNRDVEYTAGQTSFDVTSNISWTVSESVGWLSVSPTNGGGDGTLTVSYDAQTSTSERVGTISISGGGITRNVTVTQEGAPASLTVDPSNRDVGYASGQTTFDVISNISWTVSESVGWLSVSPTDGSDDGTLTVTYDENTSTSERVGTISVSGSGITRNVTVTQAEAAPNLTVDPSNRDVSNAAGQTTLNVASNISWTVSESVGWLSVSPTSGSGDGILTVDYEANPSTGQRIGIITVSGDGFTREVTVTQLGAAASLTVDPSNRDVGYAAGQTSFDVTSNISWTVSESVGWLSVSPTSGSGDGTLTVTYDENTSTSERVGTIGVSGSGITREVTVTQAEAAASLTVDPSNRDVGYASGQTTFDVSSNISWTVSESVGWLSLSPTSGSDDGTLTVTYDENTSTSERVGTISVSGSGITRNVTVTQAGAAANLTVDPSNRDVGYAAGQTSFAVTSNISWTVSESVGWLSVSPTSGSGDGTLTVTYDANSSSSERTGTIGISGDGITRNVTVTQEDAPARLTVDPSNRDVGYAAGQTTFDVSSNISWTVSESVGWLSVSPTSGSDDGTLTATYDENTSTSERVGTISVSGSGITRNVTVTQAEAAPNLTMDPSNRDVSNAAGQTTYSVNSNISWTVSESVGWLSVSPTNGNDDGTLTVTFEANPSTGQRVGTISVSGNGLTRNVTVTQLGSAASLSVTPLNRDVGYEAGQSSFEVISNISWTVSESVGWLSVSPTNGSGDGTLTVTYDGNTSTSERVGTISVSGSGITREVTVTQAGAAAHLTVDPSNRDVSNAAGQTTFDVTSNISWIVSESVDWLSVSPTDGSDDGTLTVTYGENTSTSERVGTISLSGSGITRNVTVTQLGSAASLTVTPSNRDVGYEAGQSSFEVSSNISWIVSERVEWLSVDPMSGNGDGSLIVDFEENKETENREGVITVSGGGIERHVSINQMAAPMLTISPTICSIGSESCDTILVVKSNIDWLIEINEIWVSVTPTSGSGNDTLQVHIEENSEVSPRTAILTITGSGLSVDVDFEQDGVTGIADNEIGLPSDFILEQNYPNPFNPSTTIRFSLPKKSDVILELYNSSGQIINILVNNNLNAGYHSIVWNASHLSSGTYFCRLKTKEFQGIVKMMLVK